MKHIFKYVIKLLYYKITVVSTYGSSENNFHTYF